MTSSQLLVRPLAPSELMYFRFGLYVGYSTRVRGRLDPTVLARAFETLRAAYPVLSTRLVQDDESGPAIAAVPDVAAALFDVVGPVEDPLHELPDLDGRAAAIHTVRGGDDTAAVTLLTHHAIADGHHSLHLLSELWKYYTAHAEGAPAAPARHAYPHSLEHLLAARGIRTAPALELPDTDGVESLADTSANPAERVRIRLSANETRLLLAAGRQHGTTINGLVSAALLAATAQGRGVDIDTLHYTYPVDLRSRVSPRIGYPEGTNVLSIAYFAADPHSERDLLALARAVSATLRESIATGTLFTGGAELASMLTPEALSSALISTNWGVIPPLRTPADLTIEDFHPLMSNGSLPTLAPHVITTYDGQLTIDTQAHTPDAGRLCTEHLHRFAEL
ncbi:phthiocerol/phthiodiolone dimycocerosyl transferase family protein [Nocardia brasiliensis]|uniref:phthiocerol/phthiodiolone dimycocerosyl transferase family protein n=1 Tax=Nocardia brasiliensis TaxID=37326 RepID=UPI003D8DA73C